MKKWNNSKSEIEVETWFKNNGFNIVSCKQYISKTDYVVEKCGLQMCYTMYDGEKQPLKIFSENFKQYKELQELRKLIGGI